MDGKEVYIRVVPGPMERLPLPLLFPSPPPRTLSTARPPSVPPGTERKDGGPAEPPPSIAGGRTTQRPPMAGVGLSDGLGCTPWRGDAVVANADGDISGL